MQPSNPETTYELEQGILDPRKQEIGFVHYETYQTRASAQAAANKVFNSNALWRIRECSTVSVSRKYKEVTDAD